MPQQMITLISMATTMIINKANNFPHPHDCHPHHLHYCLDDHLYNNYQDKIRAAALRGPPPPPMGYAGGAPLPTGAPPPVSEGGDNVDSDERG